MKNIFKNKDDEYSFVRIVGIAVMLILICTTALGGIRAVPSNYVGVNTNFGQITGISGEGVHWVNFWFGQDIVNIDCQIHNVTLSDMSCGTLSQQEVITKATLIYQVNSAYADTVYRDLRLDWESRVIVSNIESSLKATTAKFSAMDLVNQRETVISQYKELLSAKLEPYHIKVVSVLIDNWQFTPSYYAQIEATNTAQQKALEEKNNVEIVRYQQEQAIVKQEAEAKMAIIQAEGYANATITKATADAEAVRIISEQMKVSPEYATYLYYNTWNGVLPSTMLGSGTSVIVSLPPTNVTNP